MPCSPDHVNPLWHSGISSICPLVRYSCTLVLLFPELGVIQGNEPLPIPVVDMIAAQHKRAVQVVPLLVATGIAIGAGTGVAGIMTSMTKYNTLTSQFKSDLQEMTETVLTIQKQINSLAAMVHQNQWEVDVLTAKESGLCLFLQEECCFYVNQSGIVGNEIQESDIKNFGDYKILGFSKILYGSGYSFS